MRARFDWYRVQSIIVFISFAVKDLIFLQNWLEIVLIFRAANRFYSYSGFAAKRRKTRRLYGLVTKFGSAAAWGLGERGKKNGEIRRHLDFVDFARVQCRNIEQWQFVRFIRLRLWSESGRFYVFCACATKLKYETIITSISVSKPQKLLIFGRKWSRWYDGDKSYGCNGKHQNVEETPSSMHGSFNVVNTQWPSN